MRVLLGGVAQDRLETGMNTEMGKRYAGARLVEPPKVDDDRGENRLHMRYAFTIPAPLAVTGDGCLVKFVPDNVRVFALPADGEPNGKRQAPAGIADPVNAAYRFELHLPDTVSAMANDATGRVTDAYFDVTTERSFPGNHAVAALGSRRCRRPSRPTTSRRRASTCRSSID